ncbi:MAG TPA: cytochrome c biogenesis protein CcsA [Firmicutes bacterium]|nr:cytochrome c biogenesis protein CcsA [Bacillota bacterium]
MGAGRFAVRATGFAMVSGAVAVWLAIAGWLAFFRAPAEVTLGEVQRLFYLHAALAWNGLGLFVFLGVFSSLYLLSEQLIWDRRAATIAPLAWLFGGLTLATGMLFARPTWGVAWTRDPRLVSMLVLFAIETGYLLFRQGVADPGRRARLAGVLSLIGLLDLPVVLLSVRWWRSLHPQAVEWGAGAAGAEMRWALMAMTVGAGLVAALLWWLTDRVDRLEEAWNRERDALLAACNREEGGSP